MRNHLIASTILAAGWKRQACPQSKNQQISLLLTSGDKLPQEQQSMSYQGKGVLLGGSGGFSAHGVRRQKPCSHQNQGISPLSDLTEQNSCSPPPPAMFSQKLWKESDAGYIGACMDSQVAILHMGADVPFSVNHSLFFQNSCVQAKLMKTFSLQKLSRLKIWFNLSILRRM